MKKIKRAAVGLAVLMVLVAGGAVALLVGIGGAGQSPVEAWVGGQLKAVVADHLKPTLDFESLDYQAPLTVVLDGVRMTADDPDNPDQPIDIIEAGRLRIKLAELPSQGEPLRLASIQVDAGNIRLVQTQDGGLVGFSDMTREAPSDDALPLSEVLQITEIVVRDSAVSFDTRAPGTEPMRLDQINTTLKIDPGDGGTYGLDLVIEREHILAIKLDGAADLDTLKLDIASLTTELDLSRDQDRYLPPQLQAFIKQYDLVGKLSLEASGELDAGDVVGSTAKVSFTLDHAHGSMAGYRLPIETLAVDAELADRRVQVSRLVGALLGGQIDGSGDLGIEGTIPATLKLTGNGLRLNELIVEGGTDAAGEEEHLDIAGKVDLTVTANAPLTDVLNQMGGSGVVKLTEGRIARLPMISTLVDFMSSAGDLARDPDADRPEGRDTADLTFQLRGNHAYFSQADIVGSWFAMRGQGQVYFDGKLAMNVNAGPLEKLQESLGAVGRLIGRVTDGMLAYRVGGSYPDAVKIRPVPLGGIIGAPGSDD